MGMRFRWAKVASLFFVLSLFVSCGGGGGSSTPPISPSNLGTGEGSTSQPVSLGIIGPPATHSGSIGPIGKSYYKFTTDASGGTFKISLTTTHSSLQWVLFTDSTYNWLNQLMECDNLFSGGGDVNCITSPDLTPNTNYYLEVLEYGTSSDSYTLGVSQIVSEGTATSPILLTVGTSHAGSVHASGSSFYKFQTNGAGEYSLAITNSQSNGPDSLGIQISSTDFTSPTLVKTCTAGYNPTCSVNGLAANSYYYVQASQGSAYDILYNITVNPGSSEGSALSPVALTYGSNHTGAVDAYGNSYYTFTATNTGDSVISVTSSAWLNATVYTVPDFSTGQIQSCTITSGQPCIVSSVNQGQTYYLLIYNSGASSISYTLNAGAGSDEGSLSTPVQLTLGMAHIGTIDANGVSYYYFNTGPTGSTSGSGTYAVSLSTALSANWTLYTDKNFSVSIDPSATNLDANTDYYLKVQNGSSSGPFTITVATGAGNSEGSVNTPVVLTEGLANKWSGRVAPSGYSYYTFTPQNNMVYLIRLTNVSAGAGGTAEWSLYSTSDFLTTQVAYCNNFTFAGDNVCATNLYATPGKLTAGVPYYLKVMNFAFSAANTYTITITPFDVSLGCNSGGATCVNFEAGIPTVDSFTNSPTTPIISNSAWALASSSIGTGAQSFKSTAPGGKQGVPYYSCFEFSATDVTWIGISSTLVTTGTNDYFNLYIDGYLATIDSGMTAWGRSVYIPSSSGNHTYEWCYQKNSTATSDFVEADDIELNY